MFIQKKNHPFTFVFILLLFTIFIFSGVLIIAFGSSIYSETASLMNENSNSRICHSYISSKIHQYDCSDMIDVTTRDEKSVLMLSTMINGTKYTTYLYEYNGFLCEYFTYADLDFNLEDGTKIIEMTNVSFNITNKLLSVEYYDDSYRYHTLDIFLHS